MAELCYTLPVIHRHSGHLLPFLEVQGLRAVGEEEDEKNDKAEMP
jgi:hypothetical protein